MKNEPEWTAKAVTVPVALLTDQQLSDSELRAWLLLAAHCKNDEAHCMPSVSRLAGVLGKSSRRVTDGLRGLEEKGYVQREFHVGTATVYHLPHLAVEECHEHTPDKNVAGGGGAKTTKAKRIYVMCRECGERHSFPYSNAAINRLLSAPDPCPRCGRLMDVQP